LLNWSIPRSRTEASDGAPGEAVESPGDAPAARIKPHKLCPRRAAWPSFSPSYAFGGKEDFMRNSKVQWILLAVCFLLCPLGASAQTPDFERFWTTVGSAGTLDEKSEGKVFFDRAVVQKGQAVVVSKASGQPRAEGGVDETDSAVIRYNVTAVDGMFGGKAPAMAVRFRAEGVGARVIAQLIEVDLVTGAEVTRLTFDSDAPGVPALSGYHVFDVFDCRGSGFDFTRKAYYIEATLTTSSLVVGSAAGIEIIQLQATSC
jgi:hypothetical protein